MPNGPNPLPEPNSSDDDGPVPDEADAVSVDEGTSSSRALQRCHPSPNHPKKVEPPVAVLLAAGLPMSSSSALLDLTWDALFAALDYLSEEELQRVGLGRALYEIPFDEPCGGWWDADRLRVWRFSMSMQLKAAARHEAELRLDLDAAPVPPVVLGEFQSDRDLVRLNVAVVLAVVLTHDEPPERLMTTACALALLTVVDPRFSPLKGRLKGEVLQKAGSALGETGERVRELLLRLRYEESPSADLLGRLQGAFEELLALPRTPTSGVLLLREGPRGPEVVLGERTCVLSVFEADSIARLPQPDEQPVFGTKALAKLWGLEEGENRAASARYSQLADKLLKQLGVECLLRIPRRGGQFRLNLPLEDA